MCEMQDKMQKNGPTKGGKKYTMTNKVAIGVCDLYKKFGTQFFRRIWFPRAVYRAPPTLVGEIILQRKSTPFVATIAMVDLFAIISRERQATYLT